MKQAKTIFVILLICSININIKLCAQATNKIDTIGNIGIGTTTPSNKLVVSNGNANGFEVVPSSTITDLLSYNRTVSDYTHMRFNALKFNFDTREVANVFSLSTSGEAAFARSGTFGTYGRYTPWFASLPGLTGKGLELFYNSYDDAARIQGYDRTNLVYTPVNIYGSNVLINATAGGNVGIGTSNPSNKLVVSNSNANGFEVVPSSTITDLLSYDRTTSDYTHMRFNALKFNFDTREVSNVFSLSTSGEAAFARSGTFGSYGRFTAWSALLPGLTGKGLELFYNSADDAARIQGYDRTNLTYTPVRIFGSNVLINASAGGNVGIGTASPSEKLSVDGNVYANGNISAYGFVKSKKVIVSQTLWPDYVFDDDYRMRSLPSLGEYISIHKHLPDIPSANEVKEKGIDLGDTQALLLKKIEELTLYLIQQDKKINQVMADNKKLKQIIKNRK